MTGFNSKREAAADKQKLWDKPSVAFDEWWNGDNDESTNPYRLESGAYWAWAGWKAALAQPVQESAASVQVKDGILVGSHRNTNKPFPDGQYNLWPIHTTPPLPAQEPVAHVYLFDHEGRPRIAWDNAKGIKTGDKLYTAPPQLE